MDSFEASVTNQPDQSANQPDQNDTGEEEWYVSDLQLAAELGKTLLERNQDLEINLKQQQAIIEEQAQEILFLSRQSAALKEVNDSRLRIYEQLEVSVTELEKTNQKLLSESGSDKKRIRRLCDSVDILETKCEELQKLVDELKTNDRLRKRERNRTVVPLAEEIKPQSELRRRFSIENGSISSEACSDELEVAKIRSSVSKLTSQLSKEQRKSEELQAQVTLMAEENTNLREQVSLLQEQQERLVFFHQAERLYLACHKCKNTPTDNDTDSPIVTEVESGEEPTVGPCTLVQLKNGAVAYGSQESLASVGVVVEEKENPQSKMSQRNCISLLSELDAQYRAVIEKYEDLLHTRRQQVGEYYEDLSINSINSESSRSGNAARSLSEEFSEASDLSSGFSDSSEKSYTDQEVQTDTNEDVSAHDDDGKDNEKDNPVSTHFKGSPEYKQLFQEIFDILKRPASIPQVTPSVPEPKEQQKNKANRKQRHLKYSPMKHDVNSYAHASSKPFFVVSPQSVIGYPVFKMPGAMSYAEVLEKGSKYGKPLMYKLNKP